MKNFVYLLLLAFIFSCSNDDGNENENVSSTSLKVIISDLDTNLVSGVEVWTDPATENLYTNGQGEVTFISIEPREYTVRARLPEDIVQFSTEVVLKEGIQNQLFMQIEVVKPIMYPEKPEIEEIIEEAYGLLHDRYIFDASGYVLYWGDIGADVVYTDYRSNTHYNGFDTYYFEGSNDFIYYVWESHYRGIASTINYGLSELKSLDRELSFEEKTQKAELMFLRGLLYFNMVKIYGNPLVVTEDDYRTNFSPSLQGGKEAYNLIISDLTYAKEYLPSYTSSTVASAEAATALLGKVYLQSAGFPMLIEDHYNKAIEQFQEIEGKFSLMQNYKDLFQEESQTNSEVIFKVDFDASKRYGGNYGALWGPLGYVRNDFLRLPLGVVDSYFEDTSSILYPVSFPVESPDVRFYQNIATFKVEEGNRIDAEDTNDWRPYKYKKDINMAVQEGNENFDFIVLRYADVLLMKAEAINAVAGPTPEAYELVNEVRRRAYLDESHDVSTGLTKSEFLQVILAERKKEFFMEGHRKDDLIRTQMLEKIINDFNKQEKSNHQRNYEPHNYIWPIPAKELIVNPNAKQNPGY